jgi:hypothetical protein
MLSSVSVDVRGIVSIALATLACSTGTDVAQPAVDAAPAPTTYAFETFSGSLFYAADDWVVEGRRRAAALPAAIAQSEADVLCLQGVWLTGDRRAVLDAARTKFPYSVDLPSDDDTPVDDPRGVDGAVPKPFAAPPCDASLDALATCANKCATPAGSLSSLACYRSSCGAERDALPARCRTCVDAQLTSGAPVSRATSRCLTKNEPFPYDGNHGLLLLSRHPLEAPLRRMLPSTENRVGVLRANVRFPNGATVAAYCSALTWPRTEDPYPGRYGSFVTEHVLQTQQILDWMKETPRAALMIETGTSTEHAVDGMIVVASYQPEGLTNFASSLLDALAPGAIPACTMCGSNPLNSPGERRWTSHVFLRGLDRSMIKSTYRTYLGAVVPVPQTARGATVVPLSAQFGYRALLTVNP